MMRNSRKSWNRADASWESIRRRRREYFRKTARGQSVETTLLGVPVFSVCGSKKTGKTTFVRGTVREMTRRGWKILYLKHDGHDFEPDTEGTDSFAIRKAGAKVSAVWSKHHVSYNQDIDGLEVETVLANALAMADFEPDFVLIEGLKARNFPKIHMNTFDWPFEKDDYCGAADYIGNIIDEIRNGQYIRK